MHVLKWLGSEACSRSQEPWLLGETAFCCHSSAGLIRHSVYNGKTIETLISSPVRVRGRYTHSRVKLQVGTTWTRAAEAGALKDSTLEDCDSLWFSCHTLALFCPSCSYTANRMVYLKWLLRKEPASNSFYRLLISQTYLRKTWKWRSHVTIYNHTGHL